MREQLLAQIESLERGLQEMMETPDQVRFGEFQAASRRLTCLRVQLVFEGA